MADFVNRYLHIDDFASSMESEDFATDLYNKFVFSFEAGKFDLKKCSLNYRHSISNSC